MNTLPEDIQDTIYKYKHQLEYKNVVHKIVKFKRNSMRAFPLLCYECYRNKALCDECLYNFEIKMSDCDDCCDDCDGYDNLSDISIPFDFRWSLY